MWSLRVTVFLFFLSYYFVHLFSILDSRSDAFASSDCWKIQKSLILLQRSAVGRRKREIRTETGEKINVYADVLVTKKIWLLFKSVNSSESPSPSPRREKKKSKKKKKKRYSRMDLQMFGCLICCNSQLFLFQWCISRWAGQQVGYLNKMSILVLKNIIWQFLFKVLQMEGIRCQIRERRRVTVQ